MRIAIISDLHANLESAIAITKHLVTADMVLCLGDVVGYYCQVNEVIEWTQEHVDLCILGNHDAYVLDRLPHGIPESVEFGVNYAKQVIRNDHLEWLRSLPLIWGGILGEKHFLIAHGSPWNTLKDYVYPDNQYQERFDEFSFDVIALGQTHRFFQKQLQNKLLLNPGSVGQSRDASTLGKATGVIIDTRTMEVSRFIEPYDAAKVMEIARSCGAGEWINKYLI
jgi:predicted phosphodiesterase